MPNAKVAKINRIFLWITNFLKFIWALLQIKVLQLITPKMNTTDSSMNTETLNEIHCQYKKKMLQCWRNTKSECNKLLQNEEKRRYRIETLKIVRLGELHHAKMEAIKWSCQIGEGKGKRRKARNTNNESKQANIKRIYLLITNIQNFICTQLSKYCN